ncbi:MAG: YebC/PmpR family DNA-binding transcriptional regulator, partial [Desulfobulbaceae bacterium]|nr:YebC/PmpR family DNA-binding transcriptional regulator [Desulfobulbaceae bacterium]
KALEAGAEDVVEEDNVYQVVTTPDDFEAVREALETDGIKFIEASVSMIPQNVVEITEEKPARQILRLLESLEEHEDVQNVFSNFDISDEIMEAVSE